MLYRKGTWAIGMVRLDGSMGRWCVEVGMKLRLRVVKEECDSHDSVSSSSSDGSIGEGMNVERNFPTHLQKNRGCEISEKVHIQGCRPFNEVVAAIAQHRNL